MNNQVEWKPVVGYEGLYEVSNDGRVKSFVRQHSGKEMFPSRDHGGYLIVKLSKDKKVKTFGVHRLVAAAFILNPENLPEVNHKDESKTNNNVNNLEWCTKIYNMNYGTTQQRRVATTNYLTEKRKRHVMSIAKLAWEACSKPVVQKDKNGEFIATHKSMTAAARTLKISAANIGQSCMGKRKSAGGYIWEYIKEVKQC